MVTKINDNIIRFKIDNTDVFIEDLGDGKGVSNANKINKILNRINFDY
jgi:hypothetical protein